MANIVCDSNKVLRRVEREARCRIDGILLNNKRRRRRSDRDEKQQKQSAGRRVNSTRKYTKLRSSTQCPIRYHFF